MVEHLAAEIVGGYHGLVGRGHKSKGYLHRGRGGKEYLPGRPHSECEVQRALGVHVGEIEHWGARREKRVLGCARKLENCVAAGRIDVGGGGQLVALNLVYGGTALCG